MCRKEQPFFRKDGALRGLAPEIAGGKLQSGLRVLPLHGVVGLVVESHVPALGRGILQLHGKEPDLLPLLGDLLAPVLLVEPPAIGKVVVVIPAGQAADGLGEGAAANVLKQALRRPLGVVGPLPQTGALHHRVQVLPVQQHGAEAVGAPRKTLQKGLGKVGEPLMAGRKGVAQFQGLADMI